MKPKEGEKIRRIESFLIRCWRVNLLDKTVEHVRKCEKTNFIVKMDGAVLFADVELVPKYVQKEINAFYKM